ncbi:MAG: SRPBCC domain-containing protein [Pseudomonadota bacterium]
MELTGERMIAAERAAVWAALNDADVLASCIPGCEQMAWVGDNALEAQVTQKVGPVKAKFKGAVSLQDVVVEESYRLVGEGKGGAAGFAKGGAAVKLTDAEGGTLLSYTAEAKVGGKLAQLGSRLIDGFARKMADEFFDRFKSAVEGPQAADDTAENGAEAPADAPATVAAPQTPSPETATAEPETPEPATAASEASDDGGEQKKGWFGRLLG